MKVTRNYRIFLALAMSAGVLAAADELPKGDTLIDKYVEATGGKAAYNKVHTSISTGTLEVMGQKGKLTTYAAEPNKQSVEIAFEGLGNMQEATNGDIAWSLSAMQGPRIKEGEEKADAMMQATHNADLHWKDLFVSAETVGVETVDGKECYKVVMKRKAGAPVTRWFDKDSGLMVKMAVTAKNPMGEFEATSTFSDYRKEGDLLVPHKIDTQAGPMGYVVTIDSIKSNPEIPADKFAVPAEIKALMDKPAAK